MLLIFTFSENRWVVLCCNICAQMDSLQRAKHFKEIAAMCLLKDEENSPREVSSGVVSYLQEWNGGLLVTIICKSRDFLLTATH